jgi:hypothetical protein
MRSKHEEDEMTGSPFQRRGVNATVALAALLGLLPLTSCDNPVEGTIQIAPSARPRTADPVYKVRAGVRSSDAKGPAAVPGEPGKLGLARGRMLD